MPDVSLTYNSGNGNGPFGLGWSFSVPNITRKTAKGIPRYRDSEESDVFLLTNEEDLVPIFKRDGQNVVINEQTGNPVIQEETRDGYVIRKYSQCVEHSFIRIERWTKIIAPGYDQIHWRTITPDNVTSLYGTNDNSRIYNHTLQDNDQSMYSWLIVEIYDMEDNAMIYQYKPENSDNVYPDQLHELNRNFENRSSNRYLKAIKYGNKTPNRNPSSWTAFSAFDLADDN